MPPEIKVTTTSVVTTRKHVELTADQVAEVLIQHFDLPNNAVFNWGIRWEYFEGVEIVHETVETA